MLHQKKIHGACTKRKPLVSGAKENFWPVTNSKLKTLFIALLLPLFHAQTGVPFGQDRFGDCAQERFCEALFYQKARAGHKAGSQEEQGAA